MQRDIQVAAVLVVAAAVALATGVYLIATQPHPGPSLPTAFAWTAQLEHGLTYFGPVLGPTTPLNDVNGSLWVINPSREGILEMNATRGSLVYGASPFTVGGDSLRVDIARDFAVTGSPLEAVYYIVPARDWPINGTTGPSLRNGALAFFAGPDFVAADPFNGSVFFRYHLPFVPTWTGQDPASAGNLLIAPSQRVLTLGLFVFPVGPYEYFFASDGNHTAVFETDYVHAGYCPCSLASGQVMFWLNATLSARPLVYYNQNDVTSFQAFRSGPGQAVVFPLANHTLEIVNVTGVPRGWIPLTLGGLPATAVGDIGYVQAPGDLRLFVPVRSATSTGFIAVDLRSMSEAFEYVAGEANLDPVGPPLSRTGDRIFTAWYAPGDNATHFAALNGTGQPILASIAAVPGRAQSVFLVFEKSDLFVESQSGQVVTLATDYPLTGNVTPTAFPLALPSPRTVVHYAGTPFGTRYGTLLSSQELVGVWTDPWTATTTVFGLSLPPMAVT